MKAIIDIDENVFTRLFDNGLEDYAIVNDDLFAVAKAIRNCIPIPKGHGRLIDEKEIYDVVISVFDDARYSPKTFLNVIHNQCIGVVGADRTESEE